jgi:hypothetical protein
MRKTKSKRTDRIKRAQRATSQQRATNEPKADAKAEPFDESDGTVDAEMEIDTERYDR